MLPCENPKPSYFGQRGLPTCVEPVTLPRNTYLGANWSRHHINKTNSFFKLGHYFANGWKLNTEASYTDIDSDTKIGQPFSDSKVARGVANKLSPQYSDGWKYDRMLINPINYTKSNKQLGIKFDFTGTYDLFNHTHDAYLGYSYNRENINSQYAQIFDFNKEYDLIRGNFGNAGTCQAVRDKRYKIVGFNGSEVPEPNWGLYDGKGNHQVYHINCKDAYIRGSGQPNPKGAFVDAQYNFDHYQNTAKTHGFTLSNRFNFDKWHFLLGLRYTLYKQKQIKRTLVRNGESTEVWNNNRREIWQREWIDNGCNLPQYYDPNYCKPFVEDFLIKTPSITKHKFIPYFGLTYDITPEHNVYASYTQTFKPQDDSDYNQETILPPTIGTNYEIGWKSSLLNKKLNTSLALFRVEQKNRAIVRFDYINWNTYAEPAGRVVSNGVDAEISGNLTDNWKLFAGYTYNKSKFKKEEDFNHKGELNFSKHTPEHIFRLYTSYRIPHTKLTVGGGVSAQSKTSSLYNIKQGGYAIWNGHLQYAINPHANVSLIGTNLTDKIYFENNPNRMLTINNFYGQPRTLTLKLDWKF